MTNDAARPTILIVAPWTGEASSAAIVEALGEGGLAVECVASAADCLQVLRRVTPDAVVVERQLPDSDEWELVRVLKSVAATRAAPIIAVTADDARRHVERAFVVGCEAFLVRPFEPEVLLLQLRRLLRQSKGPAPQIG